MNLSDNTPFVLVCSGFAIAVLALAVASLREAAAMKRWPVAKGRVLSSKVEEYRELTPVPAILEVPAGAWCSIVPSWSTSMKSTDSIFMGNELPKAPG